IYPEYGLASNKGYSAPRHLKALREIGPSPLHRQSFAPVWTNAPTQELLGFMQQEAVLEASELEMDGEASATPELGDEELIPVPDGSE
ncbi:MAG TPA: hypothetical protein VFU86_03150, partial [Terriglobales bacterium]|nr:hypothetical protein [Terriglobales bacterium]